MTLRCFYLPWGDARESRNIPSIETSNHNLDLWGVTYRERERMRERERDRGVRASAVSECVLFVQRYKRGQNKTSEQHYAHLGVATRLARRAFAIHLAHASPIAKPCLEALCMSSSSSRCFAMMAYSLSARWAMHPLQRILRKDVGACWKYSTYP